MVHDIEARGEHAMTEGDLEALVATAQVLEGPHPLTVIITHNDQVRPDHPRPGPGLPRLPLATIWAPWGRQWDWHQGATSEKIHILFFWAKRGTRYYFEQSEKLNRRSPIDARNSRFISKSEIFQESKQSWGCDAIKWLATEQGGVTADHNPWYWNCDPNDPGVWTNQGRVWREIDQSEVRDDVTWGGNADMWHLIRW